MGDSWGDDLPLRPTERSLVASPPRLGRQHLVEGILTVAGVSADIVVVRELTQKRIWFAEPLLSATADEVRRLIARRPGSGPSRWASRWPSGCPTSRTRS